LSKFLLNLDKKATFLPLRLLIRQPILVDNISGGSIAMVMNWSQMFPYLHGWMRIYRRLSPVTSLMVVAGVLSGVPVQATVPNPLDTTQGLECPGCSAKRSENIADNYKKAGEYALKQGGQALMIVRGDRIVYEAYAPSFTATTPHAITSGTKSFIGPLAIVAAQDKLLDLDERVADTITVWKKDPNKSNITIRQLLNLTSGLASGKVVNVPTYTQAVMSQSLHQPGEQFQYGPAPFQVFGELLKRKLAATNKEDLLAYINRKLFDPLGIKVADWTRSADGNLNLATGASLSAQNWAKFGQFLEQKGRWQGKKVIDKRLFDRTLLKSSDANPAYALTLWINEPGVSPKGKSRNYLRTAPEDAFMAAGGGGQRLYVIPSEDLVIVRLGRDESFEDNAFLSLLFGSRE
jgi:CubicO group peptidase (beta-lactamase class C family)